jgi:drug/metabolite transporter (DMT)-like permease
MADGSARVPPRSDRPATWAPWVALVVVYVVWGSTALSCYVIALKSLPTSTVATYAFVNPLVAVELGGWLLDEHLTLSTLAGAAILIVSVALAIAARPQGQP